MIYEFKIQGSFILLGRGGVKFYPTNPTNDAYDDYDYDDEPTTTPNDDYGG